MSNPEPQDLDVTQAAHSPKQNACKHDQAPRHKARGVGQALGCCCCSRHCTLGVTVRASLGVCIGGSAGRQHRCIQGWAAEQGVLLVLAAVLELHPIELRPYNQTA